MKRYIRNSYETDRFNNISKVDIATCIDIAKDAAKLENSKMDFPTNNFSTYGKLINYRGQTNVLNSRGYPTIDGFVVSINMFHFNYYGYRSIAEAETNITEAVNKYLDYFEEKLTTLEEIIDRIPEAEALADQVSNQVADYFAQNFDKIDVSYDLHKFFSGSEHNPDVVDFHGEQTEDEPSFDFNIKLHDSEFNLVVSFKSLADNSAAKSLISHINRHLKVAAHGVFDNEYIVSLLKEYSIDTTKHHYELVAESYKRYESGKRYTKNFNCPGDWLAYFSMIVHGSPTAKKIDEYYEQDDFEDLLEENPTVNDIAKYASSNWWGDGDDYIIRLKNLDTGKVLYLADDES